MPRADLERFPLLIIEIPVDEFPENGDLKIKMTGRKIKEVSRTQQLAVEAVPGRFEFLTKTVTWTASDFKGTSPDGKKKVTKNIKMPFNEIQDVSGWARRDDPDDDTPITVNMYTTTSSGLKSARGTVTNLEGVWAFRFVMTKQDITPTYAQEYLTEGTAAGEAAETLASVTANATQLITALVNPSPPTAKSIAAKLLGSKANSVQSSIASATYQAAKYRPIITTALSVGAALNQVIQNPETISQYLPVILAFLFEVIPQEELAKAIYNFRGGA